MRRDNRNLKKTTRFFLQEILLDMIYGKILPTSGKAVGNCFLGSQEDGGEKEKHSGSPPVWEISEKSTISGLDF